MMFKTLRIIMVSFLVLSPLSTQAAGEYEISSAQPAADSAKPPQSPLPEVATSLTGTPWRLAELTGESTLGEQGEPYLFFTNAGDLMGFGGCNYFIGKYRTGDDDKIIVSSLRATHQQCAESSQQETTLLTSLVMANSLQIFDDQLTFAMNGSNLIRLRKAPKISVDKLVHQGLQLRAHKVRGHKAHSKKKKLIAKSRRHGTTAVAKTSRKPRPAAKRQGN
ncbi:MAG: META domain-containing protein [Desulfobulbaceae bacterium]|nr:META domain-containing protein [Desulfobulbaceae bacterium]